MAETRKEGNENFSKNICAIVSEAEVGPQSEHHSRVNSERGIQYLISIRDKMFRNL